MHGQPPLTNDRTPAELGKLFAGMTGQQGGTAIKLDGSNINPVALNLLNFKLPDGAFLIPTPQTIDPQKPFAQQGFSVFTDPCHFSEDQFSTNVDYIARPNNKIAARFFAAFGTRKPMLITSTKAMILIILSLVAAALIAGYPFAVAARSPSSFRSNPQPAVSQSVQVHT
jgi:hypothetical protein